MHHADAAEADGVERKKNPAVSFSARKWKGRFAAQFLHVTHITMKRIVPHDPAWAAYFAEEAAFLSTLFGGDASAIHHMGSTAVPGISAKPVVDVLIEATSLSAIDAHAGGLAGAGYEARGEYGIPGRRYFKRSAIEDAVGFHLHFYLAGNEQIKRHLAFRDYLILKPDIADQYQNLKHALCFEDGRLKPNYQARKKSFVDRFALEALDYYAAKR